MIAEIKTGKAGAPYKIIDADPLKRSLAAEVMAPSAREGSFTQIIFP
jgi:hypothetical protein